MLTTTTACHFDSHFFPLDIKVDFLGASIQLVRKHDRMQDY